MYTYMHASIHKAISVVHVPENAADIGYSCTVQKKGWGVG